MSDATSNFPKVGDEGYQSVVNVSGRRSRNTILQARGRSGGADIPGAGDNSHRQPHEAGAQPVKTEFPTRWPANAACAQDLGRMVIPAPSAVGNKAFWDQRSEGPRI